MQHQPSTVCNYRDQCDKKTEDKGVVSWNPVYEEKLAKLLFLNIEILTDQFLSIEVLIRTKMI